MLVTAAFDCTDALKFFPPIDFQTYAFSDKHYEAQLVKLLENLVGWKDTDSLRNSAGGNIDRFTSCNGRREEIL